MGVSGLQFHHGDYGDQRVPCFEILRLWQRYDRRMSDSLDLSSAIGLAVDQQPLDLTGGTGFT